MDLGSPIHIDEPEELRPLAQSFNDMRERLRAALAEINQFTHDLETKVEERSRQLRLTEQKLIQSDRLASLGQLSASMAHEINNPISGVLNLSMLLQRIVHDDGIPPGRIDEVRGYLRQISDETTRVGRIVTDLLAFSRRPTPRRVEADLNEVVRATSGVVAHKLELLHVSADLQLAADLPHLECDDSQMQQVILNLVMNAAEAMPGGGVVVVRTEVETHTDSIWLEVEDRGTGIPEAHLRRIFDPFFTTKGEGKGVGLGLSVVYGIVQGHAGSIDVTSRIGGGTRFVLRFPRRAAAEGVATTGAGFASSAPGAAAATRAGNGES
jgi:two-component system NtrC family sensor kinase